MIVRMLENRRVGGVIYTSGTSYDVSDDLGALLVGGGWAVRTDAFVRSGSDAQYALDAAGNVLGLVDPAGRVQFQSIRTRIPARRDPRLAYAVMASPPTVTFTTTNALAAGQKWGVVNELNGAPEVGMSAFSVFGAGLPVPNSTAFPDYQFVKWQNTTTGSPTPFGSLFPTVSVMHYGSRITFQIKGTGAGLLCKVNDQFVSLTPATTPVDGNLYYYDLDFGSVAERRIDLTIYAAPFGGAFTALGDIVTPAPRRGPRVIIMGDSFGEGSGNETSPVFGYIPALREVLGWDDIWPSAIGATGLLAGTLPKVPYGARIARDVYQFSPDILWIQGSINDTGYSYSALYTELVRLLTEARAAVPAALLVVSAPSQNMGAGFMSAQQLDNYRATKAAAAVCGAVYIDTFEMPLLTQQPVHTTTITSGVSANATSVVTAVPLVAGSHYKWADSTRLFVRSVSGLTATVDRVTNAQVSGATLTQCGPALLTGNGRVGATVGWGSADTMVSSDTTHYRQAGHLHKAMVEGGLLLTALG